MDRQRMQGCLEQVAAYRASGQKADAWAQANDVPLRALASGCAHARCWQARLDGVRLPHAAERAGFVAARVAATATPAGATGTVRTELRAGVTRIELTGRWPTRARSLPRDARSAGG